MLFTPFVHSPVQVLECTTVVFSIAGVMWILEGLGDIDGFSDKYMNSGMGGISFFQMIYYTFITISTIGYGDYSPTTVFSRFFIIFGIFAGVSFFSYMSVHLIEIYQLEASGMGKYRPKRDRTGRGHILVMGGGVSFGSASMLESFLQALCREGCPDIVLLSQTACSEAVR